MITVDPQAGATYYIYNMCMLIIERAVEVTITESRISGDDHIEPLDS